MVEYLNEFNVDCDIVDPYADKEEAFKEYKVKIHNSLIDKRTYTIIIAAVAHDYFKEFDLKIWEKLCDKNYIIYDLKGIVPKELAPKRP